MATISFKKGLLASLPQSFVEGTFYVTTDEHAMYLDVSNEARIRLGDFQEFATLEALKLNTNPSQSALYYVKDVNCLAKWDGEKYIQINPDTGMTSVEVTGAGNAVTAAIYDAESRKLTLTKGATYMTSDDVDGKISAVVGAIPEKSEGGAQTVKEYVDAKTSGIASDAALKELGGRVTAAEGEIDALQTQVGEGTVSDQIDAKINALNLGTTYEEKGAAKAVQGDTTSTVKAVEDAFGAYKTSNDEAVKAAKKAGTDASAALETYKKANDTAVAEAKKAGTDAASALETYKGTNDAAVTANKDAIALLNNNAETEGSVDYKIAQAVAKIMNNPDETMNSIKELVDWCEAHATSALELTNAVSALEAKVGEDTVAAQIAAAIDAALKSSGSDKYALATELTAAIARIAELEKIDHTHTNMDELNLIESGDKAKWDAAEAKAHEHANKALLDTYTQTEVNLADAVAKKHEHANAEELNKIASGDKAKWDASEGNAKKYADGLNTAMDERVVAAEGSITTLTGEGAGSVKKAQTDAEAHADALMTWGSF